MLLNQIKFVFLIIFISDPGFAFRGFEENRHYLCVGSIDLDEESPVEVKIEFFYKKKSLKGDKSIPNFSYSVEFHGIRYSNSDSTSSNEISYSMKEGKREIFPIDNLNMCTENDQGCPRPSFMTSFNISSIGYSKESYEINFNLSPLHESEVTWDISPKFEAKFSGSVGHFLRSISDLKLICDLVR